MSIITRISRLFKADMHGILDTLEEPEAILKQAVREMEEEIEKSEVHGKTLDREKGRLEKAQQGYAGQLQELEREISFCLDENNEVLAKSLIRKKLEVDRWLKDISGRLRCVIDEKALTSEELNEHKDKLNSVIDQLGLFADRYSNDWTDSFDSPRDTARSKTITQEDVELEFLHEKQRRSQKVAPSLTGETP